MHGTWQWAARDFPSRLRGAAAAGATAAAPPTAAAAQGATEPITLTLLGPVALIPLARRTRGGIEQEKKNSKNNKEENT